MMYTLRLLAVSVLLGCHGYHVQEEPEVGTLTGDVQNWADLIQNYILQLANQGIKRSFTQSLFDKANYTPEKKDGEKIVEQVKQDLGDYFTRKTVAAQRIADKAVEIYDKYITEGTQRSTSLHDLDLQIYRDSDIPSRLPKDLHFSPYFKQRVSMGHSTLKIADEVPRDANGTVAGVEWTAGLEGVFKQNIKEDTLLRWQYFGSMVGLARMYPGREWDTNFAGFYNDYDPRTRPWYIAATSGPKDVVIILDCSLSMKGEKFTIAKAVAKTVIRTLTKQDYVNVFCARASHWDEVGKWHYYTTEVRSCQQGELVQATVSHSKDLIEKIDELEPGGTSELEKGFDMAYKFLGGETRTGCQSIIILVTDGKDTDGEQVRCGPGYYTRSGYVPGPICKYNWTKVWDVVDKKSKMADPQARIFSYLTMDDGELFPGKLACEHRGSMKKLLTGENLISQMGNYFDYLSRSALNSQGLWTSPYLDDWGLGLMVTHAIPAISKVTNRTIGVAGIDATLEEIENSLSRHQWGTVYSFLMNKHGETIFHPRLKPSTNLVDDPIFIPIKKLEKSAEFQHVETAMKAGLTGHLRIEDGRKVKGRMVPATYYYAALKDSEYNFAFSLLDTDKEFRRAQEPKDKENYDKSYFNLLIEYNSTAARKAIPGAFEYLQVKDKEKKYPGLRVSYLHSSIFLAPKCHCDPNEYFYDDNLAQKTVNAHDYINSIDEDNGCDRKKSTHLYEKGIRADVLISQPVEKLWRTRKFESIDDVKWTYVGMRSGVFRTYPAHRSTRGYDPTKRSWFGRASSSPNKTSISTAYMDAAGVGKIITISQAVFEGMTARTDEECSKHNVSSLPGGCRCKSDSDCLSGACYKSEAEGPNKQYTRCATERVEAVTSLDIMYDRFHDITMTKMEASDGVKSCGSTYPCPDKEPGCQTRCYLFDDKANLITDPDFRTANILDDSKYKGVTMGKKEGEVMKELIYIHKFFKRTERVDFQGVCSISPKAPKVTLEGLPKNPEEQDDYYKNKGPIPKFRNDYGCVTDVVGFTANANALGPSEMITGNVSGPCMSGFYYVTQLPKTNLFLLVIEDWMQYKNSTFFNFNCRVTQSIVNSGSYRIINGTCAHTEKKKSTLALEGKCPQLSDIDIPCTYTGTVSVTASTVTVLFLLLIHGVLMNWL